MQGSRTQVLTLLVSMGLLTHSAQATELSSEDALAQTEQLNKLVETGLLRFDEITGTPIFDERILDVLRAEGRLTIEDARTGTICGGVGRR